MSYMLEALFFQAIFIFVPRIRINVVFLFSIKTSKGSIRVEN